MKANWDEILSKPMVSVHSNGFAALYVQTWWFSVMRKMTLFSRTYRELSMGFTAKSVGHSRRT